MKKSLLTLLLLLPILGSQIACTQKKKKSLSAIAVISRPNKPEVKIRNEVIKKFKNEKVTLDTCYNEETADKTKPHSKFTINLDIQKGSITNAKILDKKSDLKDPTIKKCFLTKIGKWTFTPFKIETRYVIIYPSLLVLPR